MGDLEKELRDKLNEWPLPETETAWGKRRQDIRDKMNAGDNWSEFLKWPVVRASLFTGQIPNTDAELKEIEGSGWYTVLKMSNFIPWNGTAIHQAHLMYFYDNFHDQYTVAEFGGGYGEMYRVLYEYGHFGEYYVYDFPELLTLQEYYLRSNDIPTENWHPCYTISDWLEMPQPDLFVSICAMSEAPLKDRMKIWDVQPKSCAIRYQPTWDGINNTEYFLRVAEERLMYVVERKTAPNYPNHSLLILEMF